MNYDTETLKALEESIEHWARLATHQHRKGEQPGPNSCALCLKFRMFDGVWDSQGACDGCPVKKYTGMSLCSGTPYGNAALKYAKNRHTQSDAFMKAARAELLFLVSLLPPNHRLHKVYDTKQRSSNSRNRAGK